MDVIRNYLIGWYGTLRIENNNHRYICNIKVTQFSIEFWYEMSRTNNISEVWHSIVGHSRTIIGIEQRASGLTLLVLDPSHGPRQVAALGSSRDSLRLIRRNMAAMRAPQYQVVAVRGLFESEEQYQVIVSFFDIHISSVASFFFSTTFGSIEFYPTQKRETEIKMIFFSFIFINWKLFLFFST